MWGYTKADIDERTTLSYPLHSGIVFSSHSCPVHKVSKTTFDERDEKMHLAISGSIIRKLHFRFLSRTRTTASFPRSCVVIVRHILSPRLACRCCHQCRRYHPRTRCGGDGGDSSFPLHPFHYGYGILFLACFRLVKKHFWLQ